MEVTTKQQGSKREQKERQGRAKREQIDRMNLSTGAKEDLFELVA